METTGRNMYELVKHQLTTQSPQLEKYINYITDYIETADTPILHEGDKRYSIHGYIILKNGKIALVVDKLNTNPTIIMSISDYEFVIGPKSSYILADADVVIMFDYNDTLHEAITRLDTIHPYHKSNIIYEHATTNFADNKHEYATATYHVFNNDSELYRKLLLDDMIKSGIFNTWLNLAECGHILLTLTEMPNVCTYGDNLRELYKHVKCYYKIRFGELGREMAAIFITHINGMINTVPTKTILQFNIAPIHPKKLRKSYIRKHIKEILKPSIKPKKRDNSEGRWR